MLVPENVAPVSTPNESSSSRNESAITIGTTRGTDDNQIDKTVFAGEAVWRIESIVEVYRTGKVKKSQAVVQISQVLAAESDRNEQLKLEALERYSTTLDGIEAHSTELNRHGTRIASLSYGKGKDSDEAGKQSRRHEEPDRNNAEAPRANEVDDFLDRISKKNEQGIMGRNEGNLRRESGDESEQGSDDGTGE